MFYQYDNITGRIHKVINTNSFWKSPDQILSITILKGIYYNSMHVFAILFIYESFTTLTNYQLMFL